MKLLKRMKKIGMIIVLIMTLAIAFGGNHAWVKEVHAEETVVESGTAGDLQYEITGALSTGYTLRVFGTGDMSTRPWCNSSYYNKILKVVVEEGVANICDKAFYSGDDIEEVILPSTVIRIGTKAFYGTSLNKIVLPDNVKIIDDDAFYMGSSKISVFVTPGSVTAGTADSESISWENISCKGGHNYKEYVVPATNTTQGSVQTKCSVCDHVSGKTTTIYPWKVSFSSSSEVTYDGTAKTPTVKVVDTRSSYYGYDIDSDYYDIKYSNNVNPGKATVTVTFKGHYQGVYTGSFIIYPKQVTLKSVTAADGGLKVSWDAVPGTVTGYKIYCSNYFDPHTYWADANKTSMTVTGLSSSDTYVVSVYAYVTVEGENYFGSESNEIKGMPGKSKAPKITIDKKLTLTKGFSKKISVSYDSYKYYLGTVKWSSSNKKIATVNKNGKVTAKKTGTCKIYCKYNGKKYTCKVTVKSNVYQGPNSSDLDANDYEYGTVHLVPNKISYKNGKIVLKTSIVNTRIFKAEKFQYITIILYDKNSNIIAKKKFTNIRVNLKPYGIKYMTFTFPKNSVKKKNCNLRENYGWIQWKYYYNYSY